MNFMKKFAAAATAAVMFISTPAASVMAASYTGYDVGVSSLGGAQISTGYPSSYRNNKNLNAGKITKQVDESGVYLRLPRWTNVCPGCGGVASEYIPDLYEGVSYTLSDDSVLKDCKFNLKRSPNSGEFADYAGWPCLSFDYVGAHPGITDVTLTFYYNFRADDEASYHTCGQFLTLPGNYNWYKDTVKFTVEVPGRTVTYTDGVPGEVVFPDQVVKYLEDGEATPAFTGNLEREGYTFTGWSPERADTVSGDATYVAQWEKNEEEKFTVTYVDGVPNETVFPDQSYEGLKKGDTTPAFVGTPTRKDYTFAGWEPAVSDTVTGDATYTAIWTKDEPEETITITYTDGVNGEAFADQTYTGLKKGDPTPAFEGTPTRKGYKFLGWNPEFAETVDGTVTYVARWEEDKPVDPVDPEDPDKKVSTPGMDKQIIDADGNAVDASSLTPGESVKFRLNSNLPSDFYEKVTFESDADGKITVNTEDPYLLTIHDDFDGTFTLNKESIVVKIGDKKLNAETDYTFAEDKDCNDGNGRLCDFHVELNLNALYNAGTITDDDFKKAATITVEYEMQLSKDAGVATHRNAAWVTSNENDFITDIVEVDVYGIKVEKVSSDEEKKPLAGAEFDLYDAEKKEVLASGVTDDKGIINFDGLKAGTYYLLETKAPTGYIRSTSYIEVIVNDDTATSQNYLVQTVANAKAPHTGGAGTTLFTAGGIALVASSLIIAVTKKKKETEE